MVDRDTKLRVLWVTSSLGGGGAEMHLLRILNALDRREFEPALAVARAGGSYERLLAPDVPVFTLTNWTSSTGSVVAAIPRLRALIRAFRPAVLCSIMDHVNLATLLATRAMAQKPPLMLCVQIAPHSAYDGNASLISTVIRLGIRHVYHRADRVVALSEGVARELAERDPRLSRTINVIPNAAMDETVLAGAHKRMPRDGVPNGDRLIVACGRLTPQKGFHLLLDAVAIVRKSLPVHLWILGEGPEHDRLAERASALGIANSVTFLGFQAQPSRYMAAADVFVLSSLFEGFANVVVEAMASGVPVVASDCPHGPGEIIADGVDGLLVQPGSAEALATGMLRVLEDPTWAKVLADRGRDRASDFHASLVAASYATVIRSLARFERARTAERSRERRPREKGVSA